MLKFHLARVIFLTASPPLLELRHFGCERDERLLFSDVNLQLAAGDSVQVLGANGAGKTTFLRALARINPNYLGDLLYLGHPLDELQWEYACDCLFLGHSPGIKKSLTPLENLRWYAAQAPTSANLEEALVLVGLSGYEDTPCIHLSAGQLRRVALARLHISRARLWILDEPFTAIDKRGVEALEQLISTHCAQGGVCLLSSHQDLRIPGLKHLDLQDYRPASPYAVQEVQA